MVVEENQSLRELTTLKVGGLARYVLTCNTTEDVVAAYSFAKDKNLPLVVLGEGSNVLPTDEDHDGVVLLMRIKGITYTNDADGQVVVSVGAGESWDAFVEETVQKGLWGLENLAGIPGTVGAAPVQNIGAYGMEIARLIKDVGAYDTLTSTHITISAADAAFAYRDSRFKHESHLIITGVTFILASNGEPQIQYADLQAASREGVVLSTPAEIAVAVRIIRSRKFPDLSEYGTAGSFFKNPIISYQQFENLSAKWGALPSYPAPNGIKIPLAFILDKVLNLKGYEREMTFLFGNQPLVLVARPGARAADVDELACDIEEKVFTATGISIEREVRNLSDHEIK